MASTRGRDNSRERALRSELHRRGLRFRLHCAVIPGNRRRTVDIVFAGQRLAVYLDGCFWHGCPLHSTTPKSNTKWWRDKISRNKSRDRDSARRLQGCNWTVLRIWNHVPIEQAADLIS